MLVGIPIGLWAFAMVADLVHLFGGSAVWKVVALYALGGGIVAAPVAAVPGFIDFTSISDRRVRKVALTHMVVNLVVVCLFALSFWLRLISPLGGVPVAVSGVGIVLLGLGGWLGGELVFVHGMGVDASTAKATSRAPGRRIA